MQNAIGLQIQWCCRALDVTTKPLVLSSLALCFSCFDDGDWYGCTLEYIG